MLRFTTFSTIGLLLASLIWLAWPLTARAGDKSIMGWLEYVEIVPLDFVVKAKLDTGAKTSSMHALDIETFERDDETWVRFTFEAHERVVGEEDDKYDKRKVTIEKPRLRNVVIKRQKAGNQDRPVVEMTLCINGKPHKEEFSLTDRSSFHYPILLGRRALHDIVLVDPGEIFIASPVCVDDNSEEDD